MSGNWGGGYWKANSNEERDFPSGWIGKYNSYKPNSVTGVFEPGKSSGYAKVPRFIADRVRKIAVKYRKNRVIIDGVWYAVDEKGWVTRV